jgi:DNA-binding response OmpR family regulator
VLRYQSFDLVVLDIGLPKLDGLRVLAGMRERGDSTPVLMLTARDGIEDRVQALDVGADDYLGKPFDFREFEARCRVLLRRARGQASEVVQIGGFQFDNAAHRVSLDGEPIELPNREYRLLEILAVASARWSARTRSATACSASTTKPARMPSSCMWPPEKEAGRRTAAYHHGARRWLPAGSQ